MDILWVTPQLPCRRSGGQVRQYHLLKHLCQRHRVTILSLVQEAELEDVPALRNLGAEVVTELFAPPVPPSTWHNRLQSWTQLLFDSWPHYAHTYALDGLRRQVAPLLSRGQPDIVQFEHLFVAPLGEMVDNVPWVLTEHNIETRNARRQGQQAASPPRRLASWIETRKLWRWEQKWVRRSTASIAVSETEAKDLREFAPETPVFVVPNGVDTGEFAPRDEVRTPRKGLLFFGTLGYAPNADAVTYFCREIFPLIRSHQPDVTLEIVGAHASPEVVALGNLPGVQFIGFVDDLRPYLWRAAVCVVPLRSGGGTRLKILEALAAGCSVVSTSLGAEGLALKDGQQLMVADDPIAFGQAVLALLDEPDLRYRLTRAGKQAVAEHYDWNVIAPRLEAAYHSTIEAKDGQ